MKKDMILLNKYRQKLSKCRKFDKDIFRYERVTTIGTNIVDYISKINHPWDEGYSSEPTPQHWSFKLLLLLRIRFNMVYAFLINQLGYTEADLFDTKGSKTMPITIRQQERLINLVLQKMVKPKDRIKMVISEQLILHQLTLEAGKEYIETRIVLKALRKKMGGSE